MRQNNLIILKNLTFKVLEEMCFLIQSEPDLTRGAEADDITINIECGNQYSIFLRFNKNLAEIITQNLLGMQDESVEKELLISSIKEIVNMVGGSFMNEMDMGPNTRLSIPEVGNNGEPKSLQTDKTHLDSETVFIEDNPLTLAIVERIL